MGMANELLDARRGEASRSTRQTEAQCIWSGLFSVGGVSTPGLPEYSPRASAAFVPFPKVYTLEWTKPASTGNGETDFPPSDKEAINICDPQVNPALYKSALDIIRLSNDYFVKSGCRNVADLENGYPKHEWVMDLARRFTYDFKDHDYPLPPDLRMLWVADKDYHPSDNPIPWSNRLWVVACENFTELTDTEKHTLMTRSEAEQQKRYAASFSDVVDYNDFLLDMFMTYLAHHEYDQAKHERTFDPQPTTADLDTFFNESIRSTGITLYDLHRAFPHVRDIQSFLRHVDYFAVFEPNPPSLFVSSKLSEGVYIRKPIPSPQQITTALRTPMTLPELFDHLAEEHPEYAHGVGSQQAVLTHILTFATPDITTRKFIPKSTALPNEAAIWDALEDGPLSILDLAACFPNRVTSEAEFTAAVEASEMAYRVDPRDRRSDWVRMILDGEDMPVGEERSRRAYRLQEMVREEPLRVLEWVGRVVGWDGEGFVDGEGVVGQDEEEDEEQGTEDEEQDTESEAGPKDEAVEELEDEGQDEEHDHQHDEEKQQIEPVAISPPASPKRKRSVEDDGEEVRTSSSKVHAIKKMR